MNLLFKHSFIVLFITLFSLYGCTNKISSVDEARNEIVGYWLFETFNVKSSEALIEFKNNGVCIWHERDKKYAWDSDDINFVRHFKKYYKVKLKYNETGDNIYVIEVKSSKESLNWNTIEAFSIFYFSNKNKLVDNNLKNVGTKVSKPNWLEYLEKKPDYFKQL